MTDETNNYSTAIHEAGHHIAADHFAIPSFPELTPEGRSLILQSASPERAGLCHLQDPVTEFQRAVVCWAGMMAECMLGSPPPWAPPFKPSAILLRDWYSMMMHQVKSLSQGDRMGIIGYRDTWRSCKSAFGILRKNKARITRLAKSMTHTLNEKPVQMPITFPASRGDFQRIVIATSDAAEQYEQFLRDRVKALWSGGELANWESTSRLIKSRNLQFVNSETRAMYEGKGDDEIAQTLFDETFQTALSGEGKRFERSFENRLGWEFAARNFAAWTDRSRQKI